MTGRRGVALQWSVAIVLVAIVAARSDLGAIAARLSTVDPFLAALGMTGLVGVHLVGAVTWRRLLGQLAGVRLRWPSTVAAYYAAQAVGSLTPGNLGADVFRIAAVDVGADRRTAAVPIVVQRVTSTVALLALGGAGLLVLPATVTSDVPPAGALLVAVLGVSAAVAVVLAGPAGRRLTTRLGDSWSGDRHARWGAAVRDALALGFTFHALSLLLALVLVVAVDPASAGRPVPLLAALAVARLSLAIPISPSGLGVQEAALAILFAGAGMDPAVALAALVLNRAALAVVVVAGAVAITSPGGSRARRAGTANLADLGSHHKMETQRERLDVRSRGGRASAR